MKEGAKDDRKNNFALTKVPSVSDMRTQVKCLSLLYFINESHDIRAQQEIKSWIYWI